MQIINNKIKIAKGETPTYDTSVIDKNTGAPYMLPAGIEHPVIEFIVRPSIYNRDDDYAFRIYLDYSGHKRFETTEIKSYNDIYVGSGNPIWTDDTVPSSEDVGKLFIRELNGVKDYRYYDSSKWVPYEFRITFKFPYEATSLMESKQYKYEITLFGADIIEENGVVKGLTNISHKEPLLEATDFIVGGSLSE